MDNRTRGRDAPPARFLQRRDCNLRRFRVYYALGDDDMYQALYRKYRPQTFDDVVGQQGVTQTLKNQLQTA